LTPPLPYSQSNKKPKYKPKGEKQGMRMPKTAQGAKRALEKLRQGQGILTGAEWLFYLSGEYQKKLKPATEFHDSIDGLREKWGRL
jgi:hypothetical protein